MNWIKDLISPETRSWEEFYRNRWQHDKVIRSTHGVNCTGGCQRGISYSWYLYSPIRVKYPYVRGALLDLWRDAKATHPDPVEAWESIIANKESRARFQRARGKGGFRRGNWEEMLELIAASTIYTIKKHGSDRVVGFSPIPAMSFLSYGGGSRFLDRKST